MQDAEELQVLMTNIIIFIPKCNNVMFLFYFYFFAHVHVHLQKKKIVVDLERIFAYINCENKTD